MPENAIHSNFLKGDTVVGRVNNCVERAIYLVAKQHYIGDQAHLTKLFVGNLTYKLTTNHQGEQIRMYSDELVFSDVIAINNVLINKGDSVKALSEIEYYLSNGKYVLLRTITSRLPFFKRYNKNYEVKEGDYTRPGHVILLIWHDKDHIYYVDSPNDLHAENYIPFPENHEVGVINKKDVMDALHLLANISTIDVNKKNLDDFMSHSHSDYVTGVIKDSVRKFHASKVEKTTQGYTYTNKEACLFLTSLTQAQPILLNDEFKRIEQNKILIGLNLVQQRRQILSDYFVRYFPYESKNNVLAYLETSIDAIESTKMFIMHNMLKGHWAFDSIYTELLENIIRAEDELYDALARNFT
ncbi:hypothetical protein GC096_08510 [Paenibacillus sp. LMG 31461]|uniref:Butirosin biosynthesis protein H N-terminal domain-containing protein n=1 Tax=Paenibacillus plantarum TaxID=2654975 RepID=A0ABX1X6N1_9BACL|nr:hypothetical protein [Paenibacillus plantarum]NOU64064.1 hypothetical protein [Paenibacillus plantarum]